jgi:ADP-ribosyl-[dinitrogen reductase] hydrolase
MIKDQAIGMFIGTAIGDALGAPLEFTEPNTGHPLTEMVGGGFHDTAVGEWTDDTAMMVCIADAYINFKTFAPKVISNNFRDWKYYGTHGTRDNCFDIGRVTSDALSSIQGSRVYGGSTEYMTSGNGSIMRMAANVVVNHRCMAMAVGESVATALITHGTKDTVQYVSALVEELFIGKSLPFYDKLRVKGATKVDGSVQGCYASAWDSIKKTTTFEDAVVHAINKGGDADTVGAVTGMIAGRIYGYSAIPQRWLDKLVKHDELLGMAEDLYNLYEGE